MLSTPSRDTLRGLAETTSEKELDERIRAVLKDTDAAKVQSSLHSIAKSKYDPEVAVDDVYRRVAVDQSGGVCGHQFRDVSPLDQYPTQGVAMLSSTTGRNGLQL